MTPARLRTHGVWALAALAAVAHLFLLAPALEDIDSINFALGLREYDPGRHQPHPPGYPVYIALGRVSLRVLRTLLPGTPRTILEAQALAVWSAAGIGLALVGFARLHRQLWRLEGRAGEPPLSRTLLTTLLLAVNALVWMSASRPLSDMPALAVALVAQAVVLAAVPGADGRGRLSTLWAGAALSGVAIGLRSQMLWLTGPLLLGVLAVQPRGDRLRRAWSTLGVGAVACLAWAVPMVLASGGWTAYLQALASQAGEDFAYVDMVYAHPSVEGVARAVYRTLVLPWGVDLMRPGISGVGRVAVPVVLALAAVGVAGRVRRAGSRVGWLALAFVPYIAFHLVFQETVTVRYALPVVPLVVLLVAEGASLAGRWAPAVLAALLCWSATVSIPHTRAYAASPNGAAQAVDAMSAVAVTAPPALLATHIGLARSAQAADVPGDSLLPPRVAGNWLALVDYWVGGGAEPIWFLANPSRYDLDSIDPAALTDVTPFRWPVAAYAELSGVRPTHADWYRIGPPAWAVGEGWALSPETGGVSAATGAGPTRAPVLAHVRRLPDAARLMIGGRTPGGTGAGKAILVVTVDGREVDRWTFDGARTTFLQFIELPSGALDGAGAYATVAVSALPAAEVPPAPVALTQFLAGAAGQPQCGFDEGWHGAEVDATGSRFRWSSGEAVVAVRGGTGVVHVRIEGIAPGTAGTEPATVDLRAGSRTLATARPRGAFTLEADVPIGVLADAGGRLSLVTSRTFSPAERGESPDTRRLGLRVLAVTCTSRP